MGTLLIVDDSKTMRLVIRRSLRQAGIDFHEILEATDGREGLDILAKSRITCVMCDWNMPVMSGEEFLIKVRANPRTAGVPVIIVTTESATEVLDRAREVGANGFVKKPFSPDTLTEQLGRFAD